MAIGRAYIQTDEDYASLSIMALKAATAYFGGDNKNGSVVGLSRLLQEMVDREVFRQTFPLKSPISVGWHEEYAWRLPVWRAIQEALEKTVDLLGEKRSMQACTEDFLAQLERASQRMKIEADAQKALDAWEGLEHYVPIINVELLNESPYREETGLPELSYVKSLLPLLIETVEKVYNGGNPIRATKEEVLAFHPRFARLPNFFIGAA